MIILTSTKQIAGAESCYIIAWDSSIRYYTERNAMLSLYYNCKAEQIVLALS